MLTEPWKNLLVNLAIYQQEDYDIRRWWQWYRRHFGGQKVSRKRLVWTGRVRLVFSLGLAVYGLGFIWLGWTYWPLALCWLVLGWCIPGLVVLLGGLSVWPLAVWIEKRRISLVTQAIVAKKHLTVVGITGSYGKTSVKELVYTILDGVNYSMMTPANFNTVGGIYRAVTVELQDAHRYLITELGAYGSGDIRRLTRMVKADWGILTEVGPQHLDRFGSVNTIAKAKAELIDEIGAERVVVNWDNPLIRKQVIEMGIAQEVITVSQSDDKAQYVIVKPQSTADGVTFELWHDETMLKLRSSLFGSVNIKNMALAASLCWSMGISPELIARRIRLASGASHRLALSKTEKGVLIDNTYSSNIAGFEAVMEDLGRLPGTKGLITSGLVELGTETARYHQALGGKAATVFDEVVLAGRTPRTLAFKKGLIKAGFKGTVIEIEAEIVGMTAAAERMGKQYPWVLWENDLPNHYF